MTDSSFPVNGACQCGQVTYQLKAAPIKVIACHCTECQKLSSSAFSITTIIHAKDIDFQGNMNSWERSADSGNRNIAKFCPDCGTRIYHINPDEADIIKLKSRLDNAKKVNPVAHIWLGEKQDWYDVPEGVETSDTQS